MRTVDIHTHMLYGIDDGAVNSEMSLKLIGMDYEQGVSDIFCTNHSYGMIDYYKDYHKRFESLSRMATEKYPGLTLYKGCEILCYREEMSEIVRNIKDDIYPVMNGTRYVLLEVATDASNSVKEMAYCLEYVLDVGYTPIIAHAERYMKAFDDPLEDMIRLKKLGCLVQINLYSVEQDQGRVGGGSRKKLANLFLENRIVDFVGTDTHRLDYKSPEAAVGAAKIREKYGNEYADAILFRNADHLLLGKEASPEGRYTD